MNYKFIGRIISIILAVEAAFMLPALVLCVSDANQKSAAAFVVAIVLMLAAAAALALLSRRSGRGFYARDGLVCVGLSWIVMSLAGCLPFWISGEIPLFIDAFFETVSGFTTTGASILKNVEALSRGMLYWRSFTHWLGGMGILVFVMAIIPISRKSEGFTMYLLRAESTGPTVGKLVPRMRTTAIILYIIYIALTITSIVFLLAGGMPWLDSVCISFGIAGTGGFGVRNDSIASYSPYIQTVCTVFMMLFGVNFSCYFMILLRQFKGILKNEELRLYVGIFAVSVISIAVNIRSMFPSFSQAIHHSAFQVSSIMTTTGFATSDFNNWPGFSKGVLLCLMIVGACAGSTGGGLKCGRVVLLFKTLRRNIRRAIHPNEIYVVRCDGETVDEEVLDGTNAYFSIYIIIVIVSFILISIDDHSTGTNFSAVLACFNNIGPGLELVGPTSNYAAFSVASKIVLIIDMLAGRLEIFPILALLSRSAWHRK